MCSALVCTSFLKVIKSVHGIIPFVFGYLFASGMVELCFEPAIYSKRPFIRFLLFSFLLVIFRSTPDPCFIEVFSVLSLHIANGRSLYYLDWVFWSVSRFLTGCFFQQRCGGKSFSVLLPLESILPFVSLVHPCTWYDASFLPFLVLPSVSLKAIVRIHQGLLSRSLYLCLFLFPFDYVYSITRLLCFVNTFFQYFWIFLCFLYENYPQKLFPRTNWRFCEPDVIFHKNTLTFPFLSHTI